MNPPKEVFALGQAIGWIETQDTIALLRPVTGSTSGSAPGPTAGLAHLLRFRQVPLTAPEVFLDRLALCDVGHCTDKLEIARLIFHCVSHDVDMLDRIVGQQEPIFQIAILPLTGCTIDLPLNHSLVVRMNPFKDCFHGGFGATVVSKNSKGLL